MCAQLGGPAGPGLRSSGPLGRGEPWEALGPVRGARRTLVEPQQVLCGRGGSLHPAPALGMPLAP